MTALMGLPGLRLTMGLHCSVFSDGGDVKSLERGRMALPGQQ